MNDITTKGSAPFEGKTLAPQVTKGIIVPMGDGPLGHRVWEPYPKYMENQPGGVTLGTNDHTESFCRVSGYLRDARINSRRLCACWNAFLGIPLEEIERIAKERTGYVPPSYEDMWRHPDAPPSRPQS